MNVPSDKTAGSSTPGTKDTGTSNGAGEENNNGNGAPTYTGGLQVGTDPSRRPAPPIRRAEEEKEEDAATD